MFWDKLSPGDSLPLLLSSKADKELLGASEAPGAVHVATLRLGLPPPGAVLANSPLGPEGSSGNLGHVSVTYSVSKTKQATIYHGVNYNLHLHDVAAPTSAL